MNLSIFQLGSLKTRITLFTLAIFLIGIWSLTFFASRVLHEDIERLLGENQLSTATIIATEINDELETRMRAIEQVAALITPAMMNDAASIQSFIESQLIFNSLFNSGSKVLRYDGIAIAEFPVTGRIGISFSDRDYMVGVLRGNTTIGKSNIGKVSRLPTFVVATPVKDSGGKVIGVLTGTVNLSIPNFISRATSNSYGKTGNIYLISRQHRQIITSSDKSRIMEILPPPGVSPSIDRFIQGYEGTALFVNPHGAEQLAAARSIPVANWYLAVSMPVSEAFAPIRAVQQRMLIASAFFTLLAAGLTWWLLKRQLEPIFATIKTLATMSEKDQPPQPLPITRQDEIGELIGGFNRLLKTLGQREDVLHEQAVHLETEIAERQKSEEMLRHQKIELLDNERRLSERHDELLATEEMLRVQIEEYEVSQKLLRESNDRFRALHEASFGGLFVHENYIILECNQGLSDMTGYSLEELIGMNSIELISVDYHDEVIINVQEGFDQPYEVEGVRKDGARYHLKIRGKSINYQGRTVRVTDYRDVTPRKQAEEERLLMEQQFHHAQKLESLGVLAGGIAHDFNNILTVITGHCFMARNNSGQEKDYQVRIDGIEKAAHRAANLCHQMLTYAGRNPMEQTRVNMWLLVDDIVKMLQSAIRKNVAIELNLRHDVPEINGDSAQIQQIVMNLIINSADAIGMNNGTIRVSLAKSIVTTNHLQTDCFGSTIPAGDYCTLEVSDNGCGMDEATKKRVFEPFFTTKFTGRGLGMSAILGIIKAHNGALQMNSAPGVGTTFQLFFPLPEIQENPEIIPIAPIAPLMTGGTVMLVEDEEILRCLGESLLEELGLSVLTAQHGREALQIYSERGGEIDVILLDLIMPEMGGLEAYHELRKMSPTVPVIICSGYSIDEIASTIADDQYACFIQKPYRPELLRNTLAEMMKG